MWKLSDLSRVTQLTGDGKPWNSGWGRDLTAEPTEYKHQEWSRLRSSCPGLPALLATGAAPVSSQRAFPSPCSALPPGLPLPPSKALPPPLSPCPRPAKVLPSLLLPILSLPTRVSFSGIYLRVQYTSGFPGGSDGKASACNAGDLGSIPGSGRSPRERNGNPLQDSCLENPMDG